MASMDPGSDFDALFKQYVDICNTAISSHREEFPYKQLWDAFSRLSDNAQVRVAVYDDQPKSLYALRFAQDHIEAEENGNEDNPGFRINLSYLKQVVEHPEQYIENPALLDWDWLKNRISRG